MAGKILRPGEEAVSVVSSILLQGGVVIYPSDTVYGILADGFSRHACVRLSSLKGYHGLRPYILLIGSIEEALSLTARKSSAGEMEEHWPGPVTLVLPASPMVPAWMVGASGGVALRMPADGLSRDILRETSLKLASTSANLAGGPVPLSVEDVPGGIMKGADAVVDGGRLSGRRPSTVIDLTGKEPRTVR